jgi:hypothetical protein
MWWPPQPDRMIGELPNSSTHDYAEYFGRVRAAMAQGTDTISAFYGCEGYGCVAWSKYYQDCRSKSVNVERVTVVDETGPGSIATAVSNLSSSNADFIVFTIGGLVYVNSSSTWRINGGNDCVQVLGQTARGNGIMFADTTPHNVFGGGTVGGVDIFKMITSNGYQPVYDWIIRYTRWATDTINPSDGIECCNPMGFREGRGVVVDHNSLHFGGDAVLSWSTTSGNRFAKHVSLTNNIIGPSTSEGFNIGSACRSGGGSACRDTLNWFTFARSMLIFADNRSPAFSRRDTATEQVRANYHREKWEWIKNYIYGQAARLGTIHGGIDLDVINNVVDCAPTSNCSCSSPRNTNSWNWPAEFWSGGSYNGITIALTQIYSSGNAHRQCTSFGQYDFFNEAPVGGSAIGALPDSIKRGSPLTPQPIFPVTNAWDESVLLDSLTGGQASLAGNVGSNRIIRCDGTWSSGVRDTIDHWLINAVYDDTGKPGDIVNDYVAWSDIAADLPTGAACADSDSDGLPNAFESAMTGGASTTSIAPDGDCGSNGYLNIEEWAHGGLTEPGTLTWTDNSDAEDEYRVYRWQSGSGWTLLATLAADTESYTVPGGSWAVGDSLRVTAYSSTGGESDPSNIVEVTCP